MIELKTVPVSFLTHYSLIPQVLLSLRRLLMMKPQVLSRVSRDVAYGLHELLKTNAANIHCTDDWYTLFSLLECIGAGVKPPASFQLASTSNDIDTGPALPPHSSICLFSKQKVFSDITQGYVNILTTISDKKCHISGYYF